MLKIGSQFVQICPKLSKKPKWDKNVTTWFKLVQNGLGRSNLVKNGLNESRIIRIYMHSVVFKYNQPYMLFSNASTIEKQCYLGTSQQHNNQLKQITGGSCQVDRGITEGRMPGEYAGHNWKAGSGITLCAAHNRLQKWGNFLFSQISYCGLILCFAKPCFKSAIFIWFFAELCDLNNTPLL